MRINDNVINKVKRNECCGCGSCISVCPKKALFYSEDAYGFVYPEINDNLCVSCGICVNKCPVLSPEKKAPIKAFAAVSIDNKIQFNSSSGGVFRVIATYVIECGGVVYGCKMEDDFKVKHERVESIEGLEALQRSKYVQSDIRDVYNNLRQDLRDGKYVLFSGTPCQVGAVKKCNQRYVESNRLLTIDIVCHGVPSQLLFDSYLGVLSNEKGTIEKYTFRVKRSIRNGMNWFVGYKVRGRNRQQIRNWPEDSYAYYYMKSFINRESCYNCKYATLERPGDFTLCDYWHWDDQTNHFRAGTSVSGVLVNTKIAQEIFENISNKLDVEECTPKQIQDNNGCLRSPVNKPSDRDAVLESFKNYGYKRIHDDFFTNNRSMIFKTRLKRMVPQVVQNKILYLKDIIVRKKR